MRISIKIGNIGGPVYVRPALTSEESSRLCMVSGIEDVETALSSIDCIAEDFVKDNFGDAASTVDYPAGSPYVLPDWRIRDLTYQARRAMVDSVNEMRSASSSLELIPTDEDGEEPSYYV